MLEIESMAREYMTQWFLSVNFGTIDEELAFRQSHMVVRVLLSPDSSPLTQPCILHTVEVTSVSVDEDPT